MATPDTDNLSYLNGYPFITAILLPTLSKSYQHRDKLRVLLRVKKGQRRYALNSHIHLTLHSRYTSKMNKGGGEKRLVYEKQRAIDVEI